MIIALDFDSAISALTDTLPSFVPIANRPLLCFQLEYLFKSGIPRVHVVTTAHHVEALNTLVNVTFRWLCPGYADQVVVIPVTAHDSATALREARDRLALSRDFILMASDVITNIPLENLIAVHQFRGATATVLTQARAASVPGPDGKVPVELDLEDPMRDIYAIDPATNRLLYARTLGDILDEVVLPKQILDSHSDVLFTGALDTAYVYVFSPAIFNLLDEKTDFVDLRSEVVPYLIAAQFDPKARAVITRRRRTKSVLSPEVASPDDSSEALGLEYDGVETKTHDIADRDVEEEEEPYAHALQLTPATGGTDPKDDPVRVYAMVAPPPPKAFLVRITSVEEYLQINKIMVASSAQAAVHANQQLVAQKMAELAASQTQPAPEFQAAANATTTVSASSAANAIAGLWTPTISHTSEFLLKLQTPRVNIIDSRFGQDVQVGKCTIANSIIGHRVVLKEGCAVRNSVIMDDCTIESGAQIQDSVVCNHAVIQAKANLKKCRVRRNVIVAGDAKHEDVELAE